MNFIKSLFHIDSDASISEIFLTVASAVFSIFLFAWTDRIPFKVNNVVATIILLALIVLAVNANTGFFHNVY